MYKKQKLINSFIKPISILWAGSLLGALSAFIVQIFLARNLSLEEYGIFATAFITISTVASFANFGIHQLFLRIFGIEGRFAYRWVKPSYRLIIFGVLLTSILVAVWAIFGPHNFIFRLLLLIMIPLILSQSIFFMVTAKFQLEEKYLLLSFWTAIPHLLRVITVTVVFMYFNSYWNVYSIAYIFTLCSVIIVVVGLYQLKLMKDEKLVLKGHGIEKKSLNESKKYTETIRIKDVFINTWPYGLSAIFWLIFFQTDVIFLEYIDGAKSAGIYNAAFSVIMGIYILPGIIYQQFLMPKIHRWMNKDKEKFLILHYSGNRYMVSLGLLIGCLLFFLAPLFMPIIFGDLYVRSIDVLLIFTIALPIRFLSTSAGAPFYTNNGMKLHVKILGFAALLNCCLNIILIPVYSVNGAAFSTLISEIFLLAAYYIFLNKIFIKDQLKEHNSL